MYGLKSIVSIDGVTYPLDCLAYSEDIVGRHIEILIFQTRGGLHFHGTGVLFIVDATTKEIKTYYKKAPTVTTRYRMVVEKSLSSPLMRNILALYFEEDMI